MTFTMSLDYTADLYNQSSAEINMVLVIKNYFVFIKFNCCMNEKLTPEYNVLCKSGYKSKPASIGAPSVAA